MLFPLNKTKTHKLGEWYFSRNNPEAFKGGLQLNFGGVGVELRMQERRMEEGIHVNQLVR